MKITGFLSGTARRSRREKLFIHVASNLMIFVVLVAVFYVSFSQDIIQAISPPSESAIYRGGEDEKQVALMVNVYGGTEYLDGMLETLAKSGAKATFFVGGCWAEKNAAMLEKFKAGGHEIGNHGFFHKDHRKLSYARNQEEIVVCEKVVETLCGVKTALFAPPSGAYNNAVLKAASDLGYKTIMWSKDTIDWRDQDENLLFSRATKNAKNGELILMHPTKATMNVLPRIVQYYTDNGFALNTVSELIA